MNPDEKLIDITTKRNQQDLDTCLDECIEKIRLILKDIEVDLEEILTDFEPKEEL